MNEISYYNTKMCGFRIKLGRSSSWKEEIFRNVLNIFPVILSNYFPYVRRDEYSVSRPEQYVNYIEQSVGFVVTKKKNHPPLFWFTIPLLIYHSVT